MPHRLRLIRIRETQTFLCRPWWIARGLCIFCPACMSNCGTFLLREPESQESGSSVRARGWSGGASKQQKGRNGEVRASQFWNDFHELLFRSPLTFEGPCACIDSDAAFSEEMRVTELGIGGNCKADNWVVVLDGLMLGSRVWTATKMDPCNSSSADTQSYAPAELIFLENCHGHRTSGTAQTCGQRVSAE